MKHLKRLFFLTALAASFAMAQPVVLSALNPASYALPGMPNYGVAQGSIFIVFGNNIAPNGFNQVSTLPLTTSFQGVSIKVTVQGTTTDALLFWTLGVNSPGGSAVTALLPSPTPEGDGTLVLTYNGQSSAPAPIHVVAHSFGITAANSAGSGPAVVTDADFYKFLSVANSARPRQAVILWGTGLGPINADETMPAPGGDMAGLNIQVYVGGKLANILYRGRSPGAIGLDQINFEVPDGVEGCYVPLVVVLEGVSSNFTTMSIASNGGSCTEPGIISSDELDTAEGQGFLRLGLITLTRIGLDFDAGPLGTLTINSDSGNANFGRYDFQKLIRFQGTYGLGSIGTCNVYTYTGNSASPTDPVQPDPLDAGASLSLQGPKGMKQLSKVKVGEYSGDLGGGGPIGGQPDYLDPGDYTLTGPGGADVGNFNAMLTLPQLLDWTNKDAISNVPRNQGLLVTWSGGDPNTYVTIFGASSITVPESAGGLFICIADASAGQFTVPSWILSALPASELNQGISTGLLLVGNTTKPVHFEAPGLDVGLFFASALNGKNVTYQ